MSEFNPVSLCTYFVRTLTASLNSGLLISMALTALACFTSIPSNNFICRFMAALISWNKCCPLLNMLYPAQSISFPIMLPSVVKTKSAWGRVWWSCKLITLDFIASTIVCIGSAPHWRTPWP